MSQKKKSSDYDYAEIREGSRSSTNGSHDRFEIDREDLVVDDLLGVGQFGDVFIGKLRSYEGEYQSVAIKTCKLESESTMYEKFLEEAYSMKQFNHPNIIQLIGVCSDCPVWIVMELAEFGELRSFLRENKSSLEISTLVSYCTQISMALSYLESMKCVHRDIAARNILVSSYSCVKLADFGLSRFLDDETYYTATKGKLPIKWMAPESINYRKFTHSTDVWMFGVCMWEIMSRGEKPFPGVDNADIIIRIENGQRLPLPDCCPLHVYALMYDCWAYDPSQRPRLYDLACRLRSLSCKDTTSLANREGSPFKHLHQQRTVSCERLTADHKSPSSIPPKPSRSVNSLLTSSLSNAYLPQHQGDATSLYSLERHCSHENLSRDFYNQSEVVEERIRKQQHESQIDTTWLKHCSTEQLSGSQGSLNSQQSCGSPAVKLPTVIQRSASLDGIELDREGDSVYEATTNLLRQILAMSREVNQTKHVNIVEHGKSIGVELKRLLEDVDREIVTLPECSRQEVSMAHSVLGSDMSRLVKSIRLAIQYSNSALDIEYLRDMLREANVLAVDAKHLLDAVDIGRKRLIRDKQKLTNT